MNDCYYDNCDLYKNNEHCMDSIVFCEKSLAEHDEKIKNDVLNKMVREFENVDACEFAMFSLGFIKETAEKLKDSK